MKNLLTGYLITIVALSLADGVSSLISATAENIRTSINLSTAKKQVQINNLASNQQELLKPAIGFEIPNNEEDDFDDTDD